MYRKYSELDSSSDHDHLNTRIKRERSNSTPIEIPSSSSALQHMDSNSSGNRRGSNSRNQRSLVDNIRQVAKYHQTEWGGVEVELSISGEEGRESEEKCRELSSIMINGLDRIINALKAASSSGDGGAVVNVAAIIFDGNDVKLDKLIANVDTLREDLSIVGTDDWNMIELEDQRVAIHDAIVTYKKLVGQLASIDIGAHDDDDERKEEEAKNTAPLQQTTTSSGAAVNSRVSIRSESIELVREEKVVRRRARGNSFINRSRNAVTSRQEVHMSLVDTSRHSDQQHHPHRSADAPVQQAHPPTQQQLHQQQRLQYQHLHQVTHVHSVHGIHHSQPVDPRIPPQMQRAYSTHHHHQHMGTSLSTHVTRIPSLQTPAGPAVKCCVCHGRYSSHPCTLNCSVCHNVCHEECSKIFVRFTESEKFKTTRFICNDAVHKWQLVDVSVMLHNAPIEQVNRWKLQVAPSSDSKKHAKLFDIDSDLPLWPKSGQLPKITCNLCNHEVLPDQFEMHTGLASVRKDLNDLQLMQCHFTSDIESCPEWLVGYRYLSHLVLTLNVKKRGDIPKFIKSRIEDVTRHDMSKNMITPQYCAVATVFTNLEDVSSWLSCRKQVFQHRYHKLNVDFHVLPLLIRPTRHLLVTNLSAMVRPNHLYQTFRKRNKDVFVENVAIERARGRALVTMLQVSDAFDMFLDKGRGLLHNRPFTVRLFYPTEPASSRYVKLSGLPSGFTMKGILDALQDIARGEMPEVPPLTDSERQRELQHLDLLEPFVNGIVPDDGSNSSASNNATGNCTSMFMSEEEHARQDQRNADIREALSLLETADMRWIDDPSKLEWYETAALILQLEDEDMGSVFRWCIDDFRIPGTTRHLIASFYDESKGRSLFDEM